MSVIQQVLEDIKYHPVKVVESRMVANLAATTLENYSEYDMVEPWLVWLRDISFLRNANVVTTIEGTVAEKRYEDIIAFGAALNNLADKYSINVPFDFDARVNLYNLAVGAIANYQGRVTWEIMAYRVADKLSLGISYKNLDEEEQRLADKFYLMRNIKGGKLPMEYPKGDLQHKWIGNYSGAPAVGVDNTLIRRTVPQGFKLVLTKLWCSHPVANFGDLEIRIFQDRRRVSTMFPFCFPNFTTATRWIPPVEVWIPCISELRVVLHSTTGHAATLAAAECELRRMTYWDKIAWGLDRSKKITTDEERDVIAELDLIDKLNAGIYELVTPLPALT